MVDIWVVKLLDGSIRAESEEDAEKLKRFKTGEPFKMTTKRARNPLHHRLGMGMLRWVFENQERYEVFEDFLVEIKLRTGHYREHLTCRGVVTYVPMSISFADMEEGEFADWRQKAVNAVLKYFMPEMSSPEFENAVSHVLARA